MIAKLFLIIVFAPFAGAMASYIGGRILLPEMGFNVPGYWVWFWAITAVALVRGIYAILAQVLIDSE